MDLVCCAIDEVILDRGILLQLVDDFGTCQRNLDGDELLCAATGTGIQTLILVEKKGIGGCASERPMVVTWAGGLVRRS